MRGIIIYESTRQWLLVELRPNIGFLVICIFAAAMVLLVIACNAIQSSQNVAQEKAVVMLVLDCRK
jgi:multisubunit Na+/H+ antiporter MnhB subunit